MLSKKMKKNMMCQGLREQLRMKVKSLLKIRDLKIAMYMIFIKEVSRAAVIPKRSN
jgi:hypothetical protein